MRGRTAHSRLSAWTELSERPALERRDPVKGFPPGHEVLRDILATLATFLLVAVVANFSAIVLIGH